MLSNRTASKSSRFTIPTLDECGSQVDALSAGWELFDERGQSIASASIDPIGVDSVEFEIPAEDLTLSAGEISSGRELVVTLGTADGDVELRDYFILTDSNPLKVSENSFTTFVEALRIRTEFASLDGWDAATRDRQQAALVEAYRRLCRMSFKVPGADLEGTAVNKANYGTGTDEGWFWGNRVRISTLDQNQFDALPHTFRTAVKRAQLAEANVLLGGDPVGAKREAGIVSETTGESSMFFQSRPYLNLPISRQAYEEVKRYIYLKVSLTRG